MKWVAEIDGPKKIRCIIEQQILTNLTNDTIKNVGYQLFVYRDQKGVFDDFQDTLEWAKAVALEEFGIPDNAWQQVD